MTDLGPHYQLGHVEDLLAAFDAAGGTEFVGGRLMMAGLERRRAELLQSHLLSADVRTTESLDLGLQPSSGGSGAELGLVSGVLGSIQESVTAIAQALRDRPTTRGLVPGDIQSLVRMRVAFALPGSLTLRLVPAAEPEQLAIDVADGDDDGTLLKQSVDLLFGILDGDDEDDEARLQAVAFVGPRASGHISALATSLERSGATLALRWRSGGQVSRASCTALQATRLNTVLKDVVEEQRDRVYRGRLVGGSLIRGTFELELDDESVISGKVGEGVVELLEAFFGRECTALVHIRETQLPSGETREHVYLTGLRA